MALSIFRYHGVPWRVQWFNLFLTDIKTLGPNGAAVNPHAIKISGVYVCVCVCVCVCMCVCVHCVYVTCLCVCPFCLGVFVRFCLFVCTCSVCMCVYVHCVHVCVREVHCHTI